MDFGRRFVNYVDRGDPSPYDYTGASFTLDNQWHDLDISSIVPKGAKLVFFFVTVRATDAAKYFYLRKKGNVNTYNVGKLSTQVANVSFNYTMTVTPDANAVIQYKAATATWLSLNVTIRGWLI